MRLRTGTLSRYYLLFTIALVMACSYTRTCQTTRSSVLRSYFPGWVLQVMTFVRDQLPANPNPSQVSIPLGYQDLHQELAQIVVEVEPSGSADARQLISCDLTPSASCAGLKGLMGAGGCRSGMWT